MSEDEFIDDDDQVEDQDEQVEETPPEPTPEEIQAELRAKLSAQENELKGALSVIKEIQVGSRGREEAPTQRQISQEDREKLNNDLLIRLNTDPLGVINEIVELTEKRTIEKVRTGATPYDEAAADAIIEKFERGYKRENPVIGDKVAEMFRKEIDDLKPEQKADLLRQSPERRKEILELHMNAAAGKYLAPRARPKLKGGNVDVVNGRQVDTMPRQRRSAGFTEGQKASMRRNGLSEEKITSLEKNLVESLRNN